MYTQVTYSDMDNQLIKWLEENNIKRGYHLKEYEGQTYLLVTLGERPTSGYRIVPIGCKIEDGVVEMEFGSIAPEPGDMVAYVIMYPYYMLRFDEEVKKVQVKW